MFILLTIAMLAADVRLKADTTAPFDTAVASAIERAVAERMGDVSVVVRSVATVVEGRSGLVATVEPGARLGQPIRFILSADGKRLGSAVARLEVSGAAARARRAFARDEEVTVADVDMTRVELKNILLRRMPELTDVVGSRTRRDVIAGEVLTAALVTVPPAVRSGDEVSVTVTMGPVQVSGVGRASGSGQVGDVIRVHLRQEAAAGQGTSSSRKSLSARIVGRGAVEISR